jgi:hypothetical protein
MTQPVRLAAIAVASLLICAGLSTFTARRWADKGKRLSGRPSRGQQGEKSRDGDRSNLRISGQADLFAATKNRFVGAWLSTILNSAEVAIVTNRTRDLLDGSCQNLKASSPPEVKKTLYWFN